MTSTPETLEAPADVRTRAEEVVQKYLAPSAASMFKDRLHWLVVGAIMADRKETPRLTSEGDASPTESILHPLADRETSATISSPATAREVVIEQDLIDLEQSIVECRTLTDFVTVQKTVLATRSAQSWEI